MRLLVVSAIFASELQPRVIGGTEIVARTLAELTDARGLTVRVLRSAPPKSDWPNESFGRDQVLSQAIHRPYWPFDSSEHSQIAKFFWHFLDDRGNVTDFNNIIAEFAPDLIHTHGLVGLSTGIWRASARRGVPIIHTLHDYYLLCPRSNRFRGGRNCVGTCFDCALLTGQRRRDAALVGDVVGVSGAVLDQHVEQGLFTAARRHVVPNTVTFPRSEVVRDRSGPITFGYLGQITDQKGVTDLARAWGKMTTGTQRLLVGGRVDDAGRAQLISAAGGREIGFLGFVRAADFMDQIDVLVVPSIYADPLPTVILEAQTAGRPVIGSTQGGIAEAIGDTGAGWTYDPAESGSLTRLMTRLIGDPAEVARAAAATQNSALRFRPEIVLQRYLSVYDTAVSGARVTD